MRLSNRSKTPPCPGSKAEESFVSAARFKADSARSPACPTKPTKAQTISREGSFSISPKK